MKQLTPEQREALMADMRSFFDNSQTDEALEQESLSLIAGIDPRSPKDLWDLKV